MSPAKSKAQWRALFSKLGSRRGKRAVEGSSYKNLPEKKSKKKK